MLFMPPSERRFMVRSATLWERAGSWIGPGFSGLIMVEAIKQVYAVSGSKQKRQLVPSLRPNIIPQPARTGVEHTIPVTDLIFWVSCLSLIFP